MRSYSLFAVFLLCIAIVLVDVLAFYWLQSITQLFVSSAVKTIIDILFWSFTIGLVSVILILKIRMETVPITQRQSLISSLYGLTISSIIPKLIFTVVISILYFTNYVFSETDSFFIVPIVGLIAGFLPFFIILYAISKAVYNFKIHRVIIKHENLPDSFEDLKIVHISDLHLGSFGYRYRILERAVAKINKLDADLILFTGDLVNNFAWELNGWDAVLKNLSAKKGKYAVLGNHDYGDYSKWDSPVAKRENFEKIKNFYQQIGFTLLLNEAELLIENNQSIAIVGVENWGLPPFRQDGDLFKALKEVKDIPFKILLSHDPSHWDAEVANHTNIALTLSGHTHGMQAGINFMGKKWSPIKYKYKRWAGLYNCKKQFLYVTRGLGWLGFPGRLGMRPEITFITLKKPA
ncbi:metallophosphoesterase [Aequorivita antarctica]|uniref:Metallophosphoesterase n=1 Tax=Aequorivita antarctica TaxID=153266 RepID=A0A5C6Z1R3_9FLAO|nr:metallophosphoesterase [Aequorivita antarctica]TXD73459.1 metallophosphoesterase [Aequorivita antarctica]SRX75754.1 3',5'-cyclic adenosine monophosphate phosphodiesterase CpdA [Aequorivita antarctica]